MPNIKKEFETYWSIECLDIYGRYRSQFETQPFVQVVDRVKSKYDAILPNAIPFSELYRFVGKKTRVTIEVIDE